MEELAYFDPLLTKFPIGAITKGTEVEFSVEVNPGCCANEVYLMLKSDEEEDYRYLAMIRDDFTYKIRVKFSESGHYWYNFKLNYNDFAKYLSKTYDSYCIVADTKGEDFLQLVCEKDYACTDCMQGGLIYQIYTDRFCKKGKVKAREPLIYRDDWGGEITKNTTDPLIINREVFGGNFEGVISKLDYLQSLGVTVIYFNPICMANSNHKYDTANYMEIDPMFGDDETFQKLTREAKKRGIKVIIDGVYNHTGSDSIYFNRENHFDDVGAYNSPDSKYFGWYTFDSYPKRYSSWWGIDTLPSIRHECEEFQDYISGKNGVIQKYLQLGISGVRLDVVDEITDEFTKKISKRVTGADKNFAVIGEVWEDASTKCSYSKRRKYFVDNELNSVMNYPVKETILDFIRTKEPNNLNSTLRMLLNNYPKVVMDNLMNFLGTHDTGRIFSELIVIADGNRELAEAYLKIATGVLYTLPGVPSIFYGDEYGQENNCGSSRGCFDWEHYQNEIFDWYKKIASIRKLKVFKDGKLNILLAKDGKFVFERTSKTEHTITLVNLKPSEYEFSLNGCFISLISGKKVSNLILKQNQIEILYEKK